MWNLPFRKISPQFFKSSPLLVTIFLQVQLHRLPQASSGSNDGLCAELMGLLRRCLDQQSAAQRGAIFRGLVEVLQRNKQLAVPILTVLKTHFDRCFEPDEDSQPAVRVDTGEEASVTVRPKVDSAL